MLTRSDQSGQSKKFKEAARKLEADESEEAFERALRKIVKPPPKKGKVDDNEPGQ